MAVSDTANSQPCTFLTLPTEIRLKIYKHVVSGTKIVCGWLGPGRKDPQPWTTVRKSRADPHCIIAVTSSVKLLLVSAQVYREAKETCDAGPLNLSIDANFSRVQLRLTPRLLNGIKKITLKAYEYTHLVDNSNPLGISLVDRAVLPNLKTIWLTSRDVFGNAVPEGPYNNLKYPISMEALIFEFLLGGKTPSSSALLGIFLIEPRDDSVVEKVRRMNALIKERGLILKGDFRFAVWLVDTDSDPPTVVGEKRWYRAIVTWDKKGVRVSNVPNITKRSWREELFNREFNGTYEFRGGVMENEKEWGDDSATGTFSMDLPSLLEDNFFSG